jgi:formate-dependent nitrite reductase membrane component NrfD
LDAGHKVEWGWHVSLYLVTKGIAAGAAMLSPFAAFFALPQGFVRDYLPELVALVFLIATTGLLIHDLARPWKFFRLITRPNTRSWLVKGGWILTAAGLGLVAAPAARFFGFEALAEQVRWINAVLGLGVAGYTAFLFQQCEGRDLWQSPLVLPHLLVQAVLCGAALYLPFSTQPELLAVLLVGALNLHLLLVVAERIKKHPTANARQAAAFLPVIAAGPIPRAMHMGNALGVVLPTVLLVTAVVAQMPYLVAPAALLALFGLWLWEHAFVRAGQLPPLS